MFELEDVIIRQIRYSDDLTTSVYTRMIKERGQIEIKQGKVVTIVKPYVDSVQIFKERGEVLGVQWISNAYDTQQNLQIS